MCCVQWWLIVPCVDFCRAWTKKTSKEPVVINRTLAHIANLIRDDEQVQDHLRRTVDFYLKNGFFPSLADLRSPRSFVRRRISPPVKPIGLLPGLDVVGCGYDLFTLHSRSCILDTSNSSENEHWTDPYNSSLTYSLPNGFFATNTPESLTVVSRRKWTCSDCLNLIIQGCNNHDHLSGRLLSTYYTS